MIWTQTLSLNIEYRKSYVGIADAIYYLANEWE